MDLTYTVRVRPSGIGLAFVALVGGTACDGDPIQDAGPPDAGVEADAGGWAPSPVAPAEPPRMVCPDGWAPLDLPSGARVCDPFPGGRLDCGPTERQLPGQSACEPLGTSCPSGDFPDPPPAGAVVYVKAGAVGGDGSRAAPFGTVAEGVAAAADGATVLIATGTYADETLRLERPVSLRGVCLDTVIGARSSVSARSPGVRIENLRFDGAARGPVAWSGDLTLRGVAVLDVGGAGIAAFMGSRVDAEDVSIRYATGDAGVTIADGSSLVARRLEVREARGLLLGLAASTTAEIEDAWFGQTVDGPDLEEILRVSTGASLRVTRGVFESDQGQISVLSDSDVSLEDFVLRGPPASPVIDEPPLFALGGTEVTIDRAWITGMHVAGIIAGEPGTRLIARDLVVSDVRGSPVSSGGYGIIVTVGASGSLERAFVERAVRAGVLVTGAGSSLTATDLRVRDTRPAQDGFLGRGLQVQLGAALDAARVDVADVREAGIIVSGPSSATLTDLTIARVTERACASMGVPGCDDAGIGLATYLGASVSVERFRVSQTALCGFQLAVGGELDLTDGEVFDNPVGVNVQAEGYDLGRLTTNVRYHDNGVNLDSEGLAIPDATTPGAFGM